jgi:hypothetical protein
LKRENKIMTAVMACALLAASALPALALENEFHGMFRLGAVASNFLGSEAASYYTYNGSNMFAQTGTTAASNIRAQHPASATFLDQRARIMYVAKADEDLKLVAQFEMNSRWGDSDYTSGISGGGAVGTDAVNLRTKDVFLDYTFHPGTLNINSKIGLQFLEDNYKGVFMSNDAAAAIFTTKFGDTGLRVGFSRFADNGATNYAVNTNSTGTASVPTPYNTNGNIFGFNGTLLNVPAGSAGEAYGTVSADWWLVDVKHQVNDKLTVGGSYYLLYSDIARKLYGLTNNTTNGLTTTVKYKANVHMLGVNAQGKLGPIDLNGFFLYQFGKTVDKDISAFAANLGAKSKLGPGTLKGELLYMSGDNGKTADRTNGFVSIGGECGYMATDLMILPRDNSLIMGRNNALFYDNNAGQGVMLGWLGYQLPLSDRLSWKFNTGYGAVAAQNQSVVTSSGHELGAEFNTALAFKAKENLTITPRFAYAVLGDFYHGLASNGKTPDNPYLASIMMNLVF